MAQLIAPGDSVILRTSDEKVTFNILESSKEVRIYKKWVPCDALIGHPFGTIFELREQGLVVCEDQNFDLAALISADNNETVDNRDLKAANSAQKLSCEDIREIKEKGGSDKDVIMALVQNSETYKSKTGFSQEKYLKRKEKKHARKVEAIMPTALTICETYMAKSETKKYVSWCIREDSLARILTLGNVHYGAKILVVDGCSGLVAGSIAERMGGGGRVMCVGNKTSPNLSACRYFNLCEDARSGLVWTAFHDIRRALNGEEDDLVVEDKKMEDQGQEEEGGNEEKGEGNEDGNEKKQEKGEARSVKRAPFGLVKEWVQEGFGSLVIAAPFDLELMLKELVHVMWSSSSLVIYHQHAEPLAKIHQWLLSSKVGINVSISESWMREIQVLAQRSHPMMSMHGASGYVLSATLVHQRKEIKSATNNAVASSSTNDESNIESEAKKARTEE